MSIFEKVLNAHNTIIDLEKSKERQMQEVGSQRYAFIGGKGYPLDPVQVAAATKQVQLEYDALINTKKDTIRADLESAEKEAKRDYYDAIPMGSEYDYTSEIDRIIRSHESSTLHPSVRDSNFFATVREHTELGDKWALIYVLAGLEIFPGNAELLECLDKVAPAVAKAKAGIMEVETAKRLAEVFELAYFGARSAGSPIESIHIKTRLAELGANPNITVGIDNAAVYDAFVQSLVADFGVKLGIKNIEPEVVDVADQIGSEYTGLKKAGIRKHYTEADVVSAREYKNMN